MFFSFIPWEIHRNFFPVDIVHFRIKWPLLRCKTANQQGILVLLPVGTCAPVVFFQMRSLIGRNITNHSFEKKKVPFLDLYAAKRFFPVFSVLMGNFELKLKPKNICKLSILQHKQFLL